MTAASSASVICVDACNIGLQTIAAIPAAGAADGVATHLPGTATTVTHPGYPADTPAAIVALPRNAKADSRGRPTITGATTT